MKQEILRLRAEGKSYRQITNILNCSSATVAYHCGEGQKEKANNRRNKWVKLNPLKRKLSKFKSKNGFNGKCRDYRRRNESSLISKDPINFTNEELLKKIGVEPKCYLTGRKIDLYEPNQYHFDHIIPATKGGNNSLDNLGILCKEVNIMKSDFTVNELLLLCKEILEYNGYKVRKINP